MFSYIKYSSVFRCYFVVFASKIKVYLFSVCFFQINSMNQSIHLWKSVSFSRIHHYNMSWFNDVLVCSWARVNYSRSRVSNSTINSSSWWTADATNFPSLCLSFSITIMIIIIIMILIVYHFEYSILHFIDADVVNIIAKAQYEMIVLITITSLLWRFTFVPFKYFICICCALCTCN